MFIADTMMAIDMNKYLNTGTNGKHNISRHPYIPSRKLANFVKT